MDNETLETRCELKYFFLLDFESILQEAISSTSSATSLSEVFDSVFQVVFNNAKQYTKFICGTDRFSHVPFFGEDTTSFYMHGLTQLLYITLKNNCIIHSFLTALHRTNCSIEIRARNAPLLTAGYYSTDKFCKPKSHFSIDVSPSALYYSKWNRVRKNRSSYSNLILDAINPINQINSSHYTAPGYLASLCNFLLYENEVSNFNKTCKRYYKS